MWISACRCWSLWLGSSCFVAGAGMVPPPCRGGLAVTREPCWVPRPKRDLLVMVHLLLWAVCIRLETPLTSWAVTNYLWVQHLTFCTAAPRKWTFLLNLLHCKRGCSTYTLVSKSVSPGDIGEMWQWSDLWKMHWKYPKVFGAKCSRDDVSLLPPLTDALFSIPLTVL